MEISVMSPHPLLHPVVKTMQLTMISDSNSFPVWMLSPIVPLEESCLFKRLHVGDLGRKELSRVSFIYLRPFC